MTNITDAGVFSQRVLNYPAHICRHVQGLSINFLYNQTYSIVQANTDALREMAFRLRYKVFCVENNLVDNPDHQAQLEQDAFDSHSRHILLMHTATHRPIGVIRVIMPCAENPLHCFQVQNAVYQHPILRDEKAIMNHCEFSRLMIDRTFREELRQRAMREHHGSINSYLITRLLRLAPLGLFRAACDTALDNGIENCISIMEPHQINRMEKVGIGCINRLGEPLEFHGLRQLFSLNIRENAIYCREAMPHMWEIMSDGGRLHSKAQALYQKYHSDTLDLSLQKWPDNAMAVSRQ